MIDRSEVLKYIIANYFESAKKTSEVSGYSEAQITSWMSGARSPQKNTIEYLIQCAFVPEFKVIAEYAEFKREVALQTQFKAILGEHVGNPGLYAFYDSLGGLLYIGKATNLMLEMIAAIKRPVPIAFPKGVKVKPQSRIEVVRYVSAYDVGVVKWNDFPKHVESLILRISKPKLNINIGYLAKARSQPKEV